AVSRDVGEDRDDSVDLAVGRVGDRRDAQRIMSRGAGAESDFALYGFALFQQPPQRFARRPRRLQARDDRRGLLGAQGFSLTDALEEIAPQERPFGKAEDLRRAGIGEDDSGVGARDDQAVFNRPQRATDELSAL